MLMTWEQSSNPAL